MAKKTPEWNYQSKVGDVRRSIPMQLQQGANFDLLDHWTKMMFDDQEGGVLSWYLPISNGEITMILEGFFFGF